MRSRALVFIAALSTLCSGRAWASGSYPYSVEILVNGWPLEELAARGTTYVEARRGCEYSVRLRNDSGERVAVALAVDGLNSIDAKTTSVQAARKWVLEPWQTITLDGWQTSDATARRFVFTTEERSYGSWLGKTKNLGIVSAAFFRERRPVYVPEPVPWGWNGCDGCRDEDDKLRSAPEANGAPAGRAESADGARESRQRPKKDSGLAATGIGREVGHQVREVEFDAEGAPACVVSIRYEYHDALVKLGVLPRPEPWGDLERREHARGFDGGYAPDPYR